MDKEYKIMGLGIASIIGVTALSAVLAYKFTVGKELEIDDYSYLKSLPKDIYERLRQEYKDAWCNSNHDFNEAVRIQNVLDLFRKIDSEREWAGMKPVSPSYPREHGYGLFKPD